MKKSHWGSTTSLKCNKRKKTTTTTTDGSNGGGGGDNKFLRFDKESLELKCDWNECGQVFADFLDFSDHLNQHIEQQFQSINERADGFNCQWDQCGYLAASQHELTMHCNFHAFHTKIKRFGFNIISRKGLKGCLLSSTNGNVVPEILEKLICRWNNCQVGSFDNPEFYYRHVNEHANDVWRDRINCQWQDCNSQFNAPFRLREHLRTHTQERIIACPTCGSFFSNRTKLLDHLRRQIPMHELTYRCSHCSKMLASERLLRDHMRNHINSYKCPFCDMTCSNPSNLTNHIKYRHSEERPYECHFCDHKCKSQQDLCKHLRIHTEAMSTSTSTSTSMSMSMSMKKECPHKGCSFVARKLVAVREHRKEKHADSFKCSKDDDNDYDDQRDSDYVCHLCDKTFQRGSYLTEHLMKMHGFSWPSGHCRFRYKKNDDGRRQLQTVRYESIELTQEMIDGRDDEIDVDTVNDNQSENLVYDDQDRVFAQEDGKQDEGETLIVSITDADGITRYAQLITNNDEKST